MALNPRIMAVPLQVANRDEHIHRFLTSLPRLDADSRADTPNHEEGTDRPPKGDLGELQDGARDRGTRDGEAKAGPTTGDDLEVERRRYERKIRRRDKAAILNPKPPTENKVKRESTPSGEARELSDGWWDEHRQRKRGLLHPPPDTYLDDSAAGSRSRQTEGRGGGRGAKRIGDSVTRQKGKEKSTKRGIPGLEMIKAYKPAVPFPVSRLTMRPQSKGLFGNGVSSDPDLLRSITGGGQQPKTRASNKRVTLRSSSSDGDWRDEWRLPHTRSSHPSQSGLPSARTQEKWGSNLPPPGNTQSTSWPSQLPSSDGPSLHPRHPIRGSIHLGIRPPNQALQRPGSVGGAGRLGRLSSESTASRRGPQVIHDFDGRRRMGQEGQLSDHHLVPPRYLHQDHQAPRMDFDQSQHNHPPVEYDHYAHHPVTYPRLTHADNPYPHPDPARVPMDGNYRFPHHPPEDPLASHHLWERPVTHLDINENVRPDAQPISPDLEPELQDFWKRHHPTPTPFIRPYSAPNSLIQARYVPPTDAYMNMSHLGPSTPRLPVLHEDTYAQAANHANHQIGGDPEYPHLVPLPSTRAPLTHNPTAQPGQWSSFPPQSSPPPTRSHLTPTTAFGDRLPEPGREDEYEVEEYGTTTNEWKSLWSSKRYR